jgi:hypothetical protein
VVPSNWGSCSAWTPPFTSSGQPHHAHHHLDAIELGRARQLTSYKTSRTLPCWRDVAVSVLTPKGAAAGPRAARKSDARCGVAEAEVKALREEEAGRARRDETRRAASTIVNVDVGAVV